jgi:hypothetical protein
MLLINWKMDNNIKNQLINKIVFKTRSNKKFPEKNQFLTKKTRFLTIFKSKIPAIYTKIIRMIKNQSENQSLKI